MPSPFVGVHGGCRMFERSFLTDKARGRDPPYYMGYGTS